MLRKGLIRVGAALARLAIDATVSFARAGGGSSSSHSSSSSSSGGGSGGGSGDFGFFDLIVLAVLVAAVFYGKRFQGLFASSVLNPRFQASPDQIASLHTRDPNFDPASFTRRSAAASSASTLDTQQTSSRPGALELFAWSLQLVYADANLDPKERECLTEMATKLGISQAEKRALTRAAQFGRLDVESPKNESEVNAWTQMLRALAEADGNLTQEEQRVIDRIESRP